MGEERGAALLLVLMCTTLLMALGGGLVLLTTTEARIASNFKAGMEALYAAEAGVERVLPDLIAASDWDAILDGTARSGFVDGPPSGTRVLADGSTLDLSAATSLERCGQSGSCTDAELDATTVERPYGANNPRWQLFAYGAIRDLLLDGALQSDMSDMYVVVWVADDPFEDDGEPLRDGGRATSRGHGIVSIRARAYGSYGARRGIEVTVARGVVRPRVLSWREL